MPDNQPEAPAPYFALPDHTVVALEGPDASDFAQAQFANDVLALAPGSWQWNTWLTPKGRVIALFPLIKLAQDRLLLLLPDADGPAFAGELQAYVFRRKAKVRADATMMASGACSRPVVAENARIHAQGDTIELDYGSNLHPRRLRIAPSTQFIDSGGFQQQWKQLDLLHGIPRLPADQRSQWTPQQLSLERLPAFSVKKGCYPGQEIVARTHFLGKAKRGLALFEGDTPIAPGAAVSHGQRLIGQVVSSSDGGRHLALAVLPYERESGVLLAAEVELRELPLLEWQVRD